ncbi:MAG TPA: phage baseplate assembly protein V, partial [Thermoleophilia bacterium]|nr:phage baseplate assembly protein V [Thermoleophilia bacterium]
MKQFFDFMVGLRNYGLEKSTVANRYYSKYMGTVEVSADPQGQGRVQVSCKVGTNRDDPMSVWAYPSAEYAGPDKGVFWPPDDGDKVWVWFDHGDLTQPRFSGSFWGNRQQNKGPEGSCVPAEFRPGAAAPVKRGFKTKGGSGLVFDDTVDAKKVVVWTGDQVDVGAEAEKKHKVELDSSSGSEQIVITSFGGHTSSWVDIAGEEKIEHKTTKGHFFKADDAADFIEMATALGYSIKADQTGEVVLISTPLGQQIAINDASSTILIKDVSGDIITMDPVGVKISSAKLVNIVAAANVAVTAGAAATVLATGAVSVTGNGLALASSGGGPATMVASGTSVSTFAGAVTETFAGAVKKAVAGLYTLAVVGVATISSVIPGGMLVGGPVPPYFRLVDERWIALFLTHVHKGNLGVVTGPPIKANEDPFVVQLETMSTN